MVVLGTWLYVSKTQSLLEGLQVQILCCLRDLKTSHSLCPEPNWLAFSEHPWLGGEHRLNAWDFSNGFPPAIEEASLDVKAGHLRQLILDYRFAPLEEAHDHIRRLVDESLLQLTLGLACPASFT